jgi:extradiol dioxygenase family protein
MVWFDLSQRKERKNVQFAVQKIRRFEGESNPNVKKQADD